MAALIEAIQWSAWTIEDPPEFRIPDAQSLPVVFSNPSPKDSSPVPDWVSAMRVDPEALLVNEGPEKRLEDLMQAAMRAHRKHKTRVDTGEQRLSDLDEAGPRRLAQALADRLQQGMPRWTEGEGSTGAAEVAHPPAARGLTLAVGAQPSALDRRAAVHLRRRLAALERLETTPPEPVAVPPKPSSPETKRDVILISGQSGRGRTFRPEGGVTEGLRGFDFNLDTRGGDLLRAMQADPDRLWSGDPGRATLLPSGHRRMTTVTVAATLDMLARKKSRIEIGVAFGHPTEGQEDDGNAPA
jgi:hypothetical protein